MGGKEAAIELMCDLIVGLEHRVRALEEEANKPEAPSRPRPQPKAEMDRNPKLPAQARGAGGGQVTEFTLGSPKVIES